VRNGFREVLYSRWQKQSNEKKCRPIQDGGTVNKCVQIRGEKRTGKFGVVDK